MTALSDSTQPFHALAYGCRWKSVIPLPLFHSLPLFPGEADIRVSLASPDAPPRPFHLASGRLRFCRDGLRYLADEDAVLDIYGTDRIEVTPGPGWTGATPAGLYGSATATLLAMRGELVMHGSAVALGDKALLICGRSGAGKSTLTAALLGRGAQLISDDLTAITFRPSDGRPVLLPGRRAVRLFPDLAEHLRAAVSLQTFSMQPAPKVLVGPPSADPAVPYPLAAVLILDSRLPLSSTHGTTAILVEHSYRRRAFRRLPAHARRVAAVQAVAETIPVVSLPRVEARDRASFQRAAEIALRACEKALGKASS